MAKNKLVSQASDMKEARNVSPSSFKKVGPAQGSGTKGKNSHKGVHSPRHIEDSGPGTPSGWADGTRSKGVSSAFPVSTTPNSGSKVSISEGVHLHHGHVTGPGQTRLKEVPESKVKYGK